KINKKSLGVAVLCLAIALGLALLAPANSNSLAQAQDDTGTTSEEEATTTDEEATTTDEDTSTTTNEDEEESCETNEACEWVSTNCCPGSAGAQWECVNQENLDLDCPENPICPQVISPKPEEDCVCVDGECRAQEQQEEEKSEEDEDEEEEENEDENEDDEEEEDKNEDKELEQEEKNVCVGRNGFLRPNIDCCSGLVPYTIGTTSVSSDATSSVAQKRHRIARPSNRARCFAPMENCSTTYEPVCGEDGQTYPNKCVAEEKGVTIKSQGECQGDEMVKRIRSRAKKLFQGDLEGVFKNLGDKIQERWEKVKEKMEKDWEKTRNRVNKHLEKVKDRLEKLNNRAKEAINNFVAYGVDENTQKLGSGERAAVVHSFKKAFGDLPENEQEIEDMVKISNGRWPEMRSPRAEKEAKEQFMEIYDRVPDMSNPKDRAAVTVMAYGLRQKAENRNLESEKRGIQIFENIFGHAPSSTEEWNTMQAITYSGATRKPDTDGDFLNDEREEELGTDVNDPDTDGDGYKDGIEVANGYDPLQAEE
ncbi:MAG TPA: Kazal-type serine protease inhibitor domain-containing protein, partial [Patescibacteria group bacterium]|nr:Kazal-type serine protease inhibitor domain-containing protein [Patescibacteria group bacterium]